MLNPPSRTNPRSVMPASCASVIARLDGAETAQMIDTPASQAFWTISNDVRPLTTQRQIAQWNAFLEHHLPDHLVDGVMTADIFRRSLALPVAVEQARRMQPAGFVEHRLLLAQGDR